MLVTVRGEVPVLLSFTVFDELVVFTSWPLKVKLVGESVIVVGPEVAPVPVKVTLCGLPVALSVMATVPVRVPVVVGVNVTLIVQVPAAATEVPHVFV